MRLGSARGRISWWGSSQEVLAEIVERREEEVR